MEERIIELENELMLVKARNARVEADKAWERSATRRLSIAGITYVVAAIVLYMIGVSNFYFAACVPVIGFILSTLSLPMIKEWWQKRSI